MATTAAAPIPNSTSTTTNTHNFFASATYDEHYWSSYLAHRPDYFSTPHFIDLVYAHHASHGGSFTLAHDIGTGPGNVAAQLAGRFARVVASDLNSTHLEVARARHAAQGLGDGKVSYALAGGEDVASACAPDQGSVDALFAAECLPLMDTALAIDGFAALLKPGGTLAAWFYGKPIFVAPAGHAADSSEGGFDARAPAVQAAYDRVADALFGAAITSAPPKGKEGWARATNCMHSWLDDVALSREQWTDVTRVKWNSGGGGREMSFYSPDVGGLEVRERVSNVGKGEREVLEEDLGWWRRTWDGVGVRRFLRANLPTFEDGVAGKVEALFGQLEEEMGGEGVQWDITWPVVLIVATRK